MSTWTKKDWTPIRLGNVYCSPACGGNCTWEKYQAAVKRGNVLAKLLGPGWKGEVWENLGWHYKVTYPLPDGVIDVRENGYRPHFTAYINSSDAQFVDSDNNIAAAVRRVVRTGNKRLQFVAGLLATASAVAARLGSEKE